jgi:release factor glutamine methyltransferase
MVAFPEVDTITIRDALHDATRRLMTAGIPQPQLDARLLLAHAMNAPGERFYGREDAPMPLEPRAAFEAAVLRRLNREPVSRVLGSRGFWSLEFELNEATLDPRPDSETLIEAVLDHIEPREAPIRVLDLGTGTGCLLLSVLSEFPRARGTGVDIAPDCVAIARRNAKANDLEDRASFQVGNWDDDLGAIFDVILCNPPYIPTSVVPTLEPEVAVHDPPRALDGGADGLDCYRDLASRFNRILAENGHIFLEIGHDQRSDVSTIMAASGLRNLSTRADLAGHDRCLVLKGG